MDFFDMRQSFNKHKTQLTQANVAEIARNVAAGIPGPNMVGLIPNEFLTDTGGIDLFKVANLQTHTNSR